MVDNGIGTLICESYSILRQTLCFSNEQIADIFKSWSAEAELKNAFLVDIGEVSLRFTRGDGPVTDQKGTVNDIEDKAVQDVDNTGGTGVRTLKELSERHIGGPTIAAAHFLRVISADKNQRLDVANNVRIKQPSPVPNLSYGDKVAWAEKIKHTALC